MAARRSRTRDPRWQHERHQYRRAVNEWRRRHLDHRSCASPIASTGVAKIKIIGGGNAAVAIARNACVTPGITFSVPNNRPKPVV